MRTNEISLLRRKFLISIGLDPELVKEWGHKHRALKGNSKLRGVSCFLTFEDYVILANSAGITNPSEIGCSIDKYHLSRIGDVGDYTVDNCRFLLSSENYRERVENGGSRNQSEKMKGRTKNNDLSRKSQADKLSKRYSVVSPDGIKYEGLCLKDLCREHGLSSGSMSMLCRGLKKSYKGWTGTYVL